MATTLAHRLDACLSVAGGRLCVEECDAAGLARRFGTPLYVISEDQLCRNLRRIGEAFAAVWAPGDVGLLPSIKANHALALRWILTREGAGCDVFGPGELDVALRCGVPPARISLNGSVKGDALLERAIGAGVRITLDSLDEWERVNALARRLNRQATVRFRVRPDLSHLMMPTDFLAEEVPIALAAAAYKPGIATEELLSLPSAALGGRHVRVSGLMVHYGRHSADPAVWSELGRAFAGVVLRLWRHWRLWRPAELDIGGGLPAPRDPLGRALERRASAPPAAPIEEYAQAYAGTLRDELVAGGLDPASMLLQVEPGRSLYADAGVHLATVRHVKRQEHPRPWTWVETDSSDAWLPDVNSEHNRWTVIAAEHAEDAAALHADVVGLSCNADVLVPGAELPAVAAGDVLAFLDTGAYQDAGATNFNALPRPATVLVHGDEAEVIKRAETPADVFARDEVPARLSSAAPRRVLGLDHVSVTSGDLERSLAFYRDLLGLPVRERGEGMGEGVDLVTGVAGARVRFADLRLPGGHVLELLQYLAPPGIEHHPLPNDPGFTHLALRVADVDAVHRRLTDAGVPVRSGPLALEDEGHWAGARCFYATDPDGVTVELIEWPGG